MAERKVLSKYFPPDFDPSKIKRTKKDPTKQQVVRLMAPFSMMCKSCGEYIYKGRKFNARKEVVVGEDYFGIKILRFYIKCTRCSAEITFKTDPKNTDYAMEHGATRNYQPWLDGEERKRKEEDPLAYLAEDELARQDEEEAGGRGGALGGSSSSRRKDNDNDPMASLEARQEESQREMAILDELQDIRTRNAKMDRVHTDGDLLDRLDKKRRRVDADANAAETLEEMERRKAEEEDEQLVRKYFSRQPQQVRMPLDADADGQQQQQQQQQRMHTVKRALHEKEPEPRELLSARAAALLGSGGSSTTTTNGSGSSVKSHAKAKPTESSPPSTEQASSSSSSASSSSASAPVAATSSTTTTTAPTSTPSSTSSSTTTSHSSAKTAAMAGMAARKHKDKKKANALGLVQKKVK